MTENIPTTQSAIQLTGPDELVVNHDKEVFTPGANQVLGKIEAVGLCFSDLKLLKQFSGHVRKSAVCSGATEDVLKAIPSYVPGDTPTVPGHEVVVEIVAVGDGITAFKPGERYLVQTDYRWLPTAESNAAFGYNFEGGLQEYVLMDERVIISPDGKSMLIPAAENLSAAAIALVEPWACVEQAYAFKERTSIKADGQMLVVVEAPVKSDVLGKLFKNFGKPASLTVIGLHGGSELTVDEDLDVHTARSLGELAGKQFDDVVYLGCNADTIEPLFPLVAGHGILNIALCGGAIDREVVSYIGRVHYGGIRMIGTIGNDPSEGMEIIPATPEIRPKDVVGVIGAGGPMGAMHVIRNVCQGVEGVTVLAADLDENRLAMLDRVVPELAEKNKVSYESYNPSKESKGRTMDYVVLMAPVPKLVADSISWSRQKAIVNIFAGIPATVTCPLDLQGYIEKQLYFVGTSGSMLEDMITVLNKVQAGTLDTNFSVAAVSGLDGAIDGIRAVEKQLIPGKIIVYPDCKGLELTTLEELGKKVPEISSLLSNGFWTADAEKVLLERFGTK